MIRFLAARIVQMLLVMAAVSAILFAVFDTERFRKQIAVAELGGLAVSALSENDYQAWLERRGFNIPVHERYAAWIAGLARGDLGHSLEKDRPVTVIVAEGLRNSAILAVLVFAITIPLAIFLGVLAGMREASRMDRTISAISIVTTSIPEIATAIFLTALLALGLGWLPAKSAMHEGFEFSKVMLPVLTLVIFDFGYIARMTRASMAGVMGSDFIRTAVLKGLPRHRVIVHHALRNAMITPFTVIVLQLNWIISGIVVVEAFFQYGGIGKLLVDAARYGDAQVVQAISLIAVFVAVFSQLLSDIAYCWLNPRIRLGDPA